MQEDLLRKLIEWRHHLHANPELSEKETETARFICGRLTEFGIPFSAGVGGNGIVATLKRGSSNRSIGLRADMDALPIAEESALPYRSKIPGVMHACGHDGHTVALLGAAATLAQDENWSGTANFIFQPAEELYTGAKAMIADDLHQRFPMERIFAFHNWPGLKAGTVAVHNGPVMAAGGRWEMTLRGLAGHAAKPHTTRDPIAAAGHLIVALQSIVARTVDPADIVVLSIGAIHGGSVATQIPDSVTLVGTLRTYKPEVRTAVIASMERIGRGVASTFGMEIEIKILSTGRATVNTAEEAALAADAASDAGLVVRRDLSPSGTGDDFSLLLGDRRGAYVWIGNGEGSELHNASYDFNDAILPAAIGWMTHLTRLALPKTDPV
jgi:amidohydrolase